MSESRVIRRLVTCFGTIQLVTALSVLKYRETQQQDLNPHYENYLVITPLSAPQGQAEEFAVFIETMARSLLPWMKIVYIAPEKRTAIERQLKRQGISKLAKSMREWIGVDDPDEIYLVNNYDVEARLLMNIYGQAEAICYGNGIGIYTPKSAFPPSSAPKRLSTLIQTKVNAAVDKLIALIRYGGSPDPDEIFLKKREFDVGYFSLASAFGATPPMKSITLDRTDYLDIFQALRDRLPQLVDIHVVNHLVERIQGHPTAILLTSNFSEASGRMPPEKEIAAYQEFLEKRELPPETVLLVKPHPRDSKAKIQKLKSALSGQFSEIFELSEGNFFYLPFELLFMALFVRSDYSLTQTPRLFAFSSACLTLEFLFDVHCTVGFGLNLVQKYFYEDHVLSRLKHESDLLVTLHHLRHQLQAVSDRQSG